MTNGGVDRSLECTGNINAMISAFECVHDVCFLDNLTINSSYLLVIIKIELGLTLGWFYDNNVN